MGPPVRIERTTYCLRNSRSGRLSYEGKVVLPAGLEPAHGANLARTGYKAGDATLHYRRRVVPIVGVGPTCLRGAF